MALKIRWSPRAVSNFEEIATTYQRIIAIMLSLLRGKRASIIEAIPQFPESGRAVPEYQDQQLREKICEGYRIFV